MEGLTGEAKVAGNGTDVGVEGRNSSQHADGEGVEAKSG